MTQQDMMRLAVEVGCHWQTVYRWAKTPKDTRPSVQYALAAAAEKLGIETPESSDELRR